MSCFVNDVFSIGPVLERFCDGLVAFHFTLYTSFVFPLAYAVLRRRFSDNPNENKGNGDR
ncbi:hypothetical protein H5410_035100 [Solanum commersonii]|uniref:Uncharacterized protein n=1 Tax=Solanum commersonii TaxID=4109 RepID=A0A9J5Y3M4_SOLCO|nr:hypothetical protein H5410_035100 [Solanum commersonii]